MTEADALAKLADALVKIGEAIDRQTEALQGALAILDTLTSAIEDRITAEDLAGGDG